MRVYGTQRGTVYGYSLWELQVYGTGGGQQPFGGAARPIPGTIQAEDYDTGGEGVAFHDTSTGNSGGQYRSDAVDIEATTDAGGGYDVGWSASGEWLEYTVNVAATATYAIGVRVASLSTGGTLHVEVDGQNVTGAMTFGATGGWQSWTTVTRTGVPLTAGAHVVRLAIDAGAFNVNWTSFSSAACSTLPPVPTGLASPSQTTNSVTLSWNAVSPGANCSVQYRVFQNGAQATQVSTTSAIIGGLAAATTYSFTVGAINEFGSSAQSAAISVTTAGAPVDLGPNVLIFDPSMSPRPSRPRSTTSTPSSRTNHFGSAAPRPAVQARHLQREHAGRLLHAGPGTGPLARRRHHHRPCRSDAFLSNNNATQNFWRGVENFATGSPGGTIQWAVSQAVPFRRMHVRGNMVLHQNGGWSSGGWISDSRIDGNVNSGPQQQWISRNTQWGSWTGSNWNMVFVGVVNAPGGHLARARPTPRSPRPRSCARSRSSTSTASQYAVFVPSLRTQQPGASPGRAGPTAGHVHPDRPVPRRPGRHDTAATINAALAQGKHLLFTPGVYDLNDTIQVTRANTVRARPRASPRCARTPGSRR